MIRALWNSSIRAIGWSAGRVIRPFVCRGLLYFPFVSETLSMIPFSLGYKLRNAVYRQLLPSLGLNTILHQGVVIEDSRTTIGQDVWISHGCYLDYVHIGDSVLIGPHR